MKVTLTYIQELHVTVDTDTEEVDSVVRTGPAMLDEGVDPFSPDEQKEYSWASDEGSSANRIARHADWPEIEDVE